MARQVIYTYKGKTKTIAFSYDKHHDLYEAAAEAEGILVENQFASDLFIIPLGHPAKEKALSVAQELRQSGFKVEIAFGDRALKGAMKAADKSGSAFAIVLGETELSSGSVELKRMKDGELSSVKISELGKALSAHA